MGERAVVTGANSGIGLATALRLAADGYEVFAGSRRQEGLDAIEVAASQAGATSVTPIAIDVTDDASVTDAFAQILAAGSVSVLVNNAGVTGASSVEETPIDTYQSMFDTNVLGVLRCTQQVLPGMREAGAGTIVNISSASAIISPPMMSAYASTKVAVESISESLQAEVAPFGIRVVVMRPGTILTPIWGKSEAPTDTAYPAARAFLVETLTHMLTTSGVPAEAVADAIGDAVAADAPAFRHIVGDASVLQGMRDGYSDEDLMGLYELEGEALHDRYRQMSGIDPWA